MVERYRDGVVPDDPGDDAALAAEVAERVVAVREAFDRVDVTQAAEEAWRLVRRLNQLVEERAPWVLARDPERARELDEALAGLADGLRAAGVLVRPYSCASAERGLATLRHPHGRHGPGWE